MGYETVLNLLQTMVSESAAPGTALSVSRHGKILLRECIGMAAIHPTPVPLEHSTRFDMASLTKTMATAMITLRFVESGLIALQDPIARFLTVPEEKQGITLHHLLTHTAGFPPHIPLWTELDSPDFAISHILSSPSRCRPGTEVAYSCMGYILLGKILESVGGNTLDRLAAEWVFGPLGMKHTGFLPIGASSSAATTKSGSTEEGVDQFDKGVEGTAYAHSSSFASTEMDPATGQWLHGIVHDENARFLGGVAGNAGLFSTLDDCTRFAAMLSNGGSSSHGTALSAPFLSPASFRAAIRNATPGMEESRGLGLSLYDGRILSCGDLFSPGSYGHTGYTGTSIWVDAQTGLSVVLLTSSVHFGRDRDLFFRMRRLLHNTIAAAFSSEDS